MRGRRCPTCNEGAVGSTPTYTPMRFSVSSQSSVWRPLPMFSMIEIDAYYRAHPATSFTNPRSSSRLSILCCMPDRTFPAWSSHCACLAAASGSSAAHLLSGRSPRARLCCCRVHCRQTNCRGLDRCLKADMAAN